MTASKTYAGNMIHQKADKATKEWFFGPWNSAVPIAVGYANEGIDLTHYHEKMYEVYLVARGSSVLKINDQKLHLEAGDAVAVEPTEVHTFLSSSEDYFHFVLHTPFMKGDKVVLENTSNL